MTASTDTFKINETIVDRVGGYYFSPTLILSGSRRRQCPLYSVNSESPFFDCARNDHSRTDWSLRPIQTRQHEPTDSTRVVEGQSGLRGRVLRQSPFIAGERRRCEPGSNPVIVTNALTSVEGHVLRCGDKGRMRKIFVGCPAFLSFWDQSPGRNASRSETVGNRLYPLNGQISLRHFTAEAQIQDRSRSKTGPNTAPGFLRVKCPFREAKGARKRSDRGGCPRTPTSFPRTPTSFPRRREPREKQSTPIPPRRAVQGGPSDRSERSDASGVCPGLNPFPRSQGMPTPPSPSMRGNNSGFEIVSTCGYRADQRLVG